MLIFSGCNVYHVLHLSLIQNGADVYELLVLLVMHLIHALDAEMFRWMKHWPAGGTHPRVIL